MRPKKYKQVRYMCVCLDEKDISFLDDHRGKITRGDYLVECMYSMKTEHPDRFKELIEQTQKLSSTVCELKQQIQQQVSKTETTINITSDDTITAWYEEKQIQKHLEEGVNINWQNLYEKSVTTFGNKIKNGNALKGFCLRKYSNKDHLDAPGREINRAV